MIRALLIEGDQRREVPWPGGKESWETGSGVLWLDLQAPSADEMAAVGAEFGLHHAIVRACTNPEHRSRLKEYQGHLLLVLNAVSRGLSKEASREEAGRWRMLELNVVVGTRLILTVHPEGVGAVSLIYQRYQAGEGRGTAEYLLYNICDTVMAAFYGVLDRVDDLIDQAETQIFSGQVGPAVVDRLFSLKRHILYLRRVLGPQRDALGALMRRDFPEFSQESRSYFMEVYEHSLRLFDLLDTYRDLISSSLDAYLSMVSNRTNEIMKTLTIVSTIMLPLALITGIFGMNVAGLPLANTPLGFWAVMAGMAVLVGFLTLYFKRRGWF